MDGNKRAPPSPRSFRWRFPYNEVMSESPQRQTSSVIRTAWIISSGAELVLGQSVDTNSAWIAAQLAAVGVRPGRHVTVNDDQADTRDAVLQAAQHSDLVIITGGLGPTADDLTRHALAEAAGCELKLDSACLEQIRAFFENRRWPFSRFNQIQAMIPATGRAIENTCGTAPGIYVEIHGTPCYSLPGVPFEMKTMFTRDVLPNVSAAAAGRVWRCRRLNCYGAGESEIGARIKDLMASGRNPQLGTTADLGVIGIRMNVQADSPEVAEILLDRDEAEVRARLGTLVFGLERDTLASTVGTLLTTRGETLSTAESCTGGKIAQFITDVSGCSAYYKGGAVTYSNELKELMLEVPAESLRSHGAVSEPVARAMADGARRRFSTTYALATTGIAGPTDGTSDKPVGLVYIALATPTEVQVHPFYLGTDAPRDVIRSRAAWIALNLLRLRLVQM